MTERLRVSVIIPYFNTGKLVEEAIASVRRQAYAPIEIILIDDGSSDDIAERVHTMGEDIVFLRQEHKGPAAAKNLGITHATGRIISFLDSDDIWTDGKLDLQLPYLLHDPGLGIVTSHICYVNLEGGDDKQVPYPEKEDMLCVQFGAALIRRWVFDEIGLLDETLIFHEDLDWYMRVREGRIPIAIMPETTLIARRHTGNMTRGKTQQDFGLLKILKLSIERRKLLHHGEAKDLPPLSSHEAG